MIKAVIFDWGGVLIDDPSREMTRFFAGKLGCGKDILVPAISEYIGEFQTGRIAEDDMWEKICASYGLKKPASGSLWKEAVENVFKDREDVFGLVSRIKKSGCITAFLSNTEQPAMEYFYEKKYYSYFDTAVFSCAEGCAKPEPEIYNITAKRLGIEPFEAVFIDDKPENIEGAEKTGMSGILYKDFGDVVLRLRDFGLKI